MFSYLLCVILNINHKFLNIYISNAPTYQKEELTSYTFNCRMFPSLLMTWLPAVAYFVGLAVVGGNSLLHGYTWLTMVLSLKK